MNLLRSLNTNKYWTKSKLRTPKKLHKEYTAIRLLITLIDNAARDFTMWFQMTLTRAVHVCCFLLIRSFHSLNIGFTFSVLVSTMGIIVAWLLIMQGAAMFHTTSKKIIRSWKNIKVIDTKEAKIWKKIRRATKPIGIRIGSHYMVTPITVISIVETYFKGTIRLLLTFKA